MVLMASFTFSEVNAQVTQIDNNHSLSGYPIGDKILLISDNDSTLWISDGSAPNTRQYTTKVKVDDNGSGGFMNSKAYFAGIDKTNGSELWVTDGTDVGTSLVQDINSGGASSTPDDFFLFKNDLYFTATNATYGRELYKISGIDGAVSLFKDINPNGASGFNTANGITFFSNNDLMYFTANDGPDGTELWVSDGTSVNTKMLKDITPGVGIGTKFGQFTSLGNKVIFGVIAAGNSLDLWQTDGTTTKTSLIKSFNTPLSGLLFTGFLTFKNKVYFNGADLTTGSELWSTDGSTAAMFKDINPGQSGGVPNSSTPLLANAVIINNHFIFSATTATDGNELWTSDGTPEGTVILQNINTNAGVGSNPFLFPVIDYNGILNGDLAGGLGDIFDRTALYNGFIFFSANDGTNGTQLWKTDGTIGGASMVKNIGGTAGGVSSSYFYTKSGLYFSADDGITGDEPWLSDGTKSGTNPVFDINPGSDASSPTFLFVFNNNLFFTADNGDSPVDGFTDLYKINATVSTLPITLLNFSATLQTQAVALYWTTSTEINSSHFIIQRSNDGVHFTEIATINAAGNSSVEKKYGYNDFQYADAHSDVLFYRLQMVDKDGKYKYSGVLSVRLKGANIELRIYPNPVHDQLSILLNTPSGNKVALQITDVCGKQVYRGTYNTGSVSNLRNINVSALAKGTYFVQILTAKESKTVKFVKE